MHGADRYPEPVPELLTGLATDLSPFTLTVSGIGVFTATNVVYLPVARSADLALIHTSVHEAVAPHIETANQYYTTNHWIPHVTLVQGFEPSLVSQIAVPS